MKVGMPLLYELKSVEENIELAKKLNLDFIELNLNYPYCRAALENWEVLKQKLDEYDLSTTLHFFDDFDFFGPSEVVDTYISLFKKYVELAGKCNLKIVNVHLNPSQYTTINGKKVYHFESDMKESQKRFLGIAEKLEKICKHNQCELSFENTVMTKGLSRLYGLLVKEGFNFTYDIGHDFCDREKVLATMAKKLPNIVEFHIHDSNKKTAHLPLGKGEIYFQPFKELAFKLNSYALIEVREQEALVQSVQTFFGL